MSTFDDLTLTLKFLAALGCGLMAGLFFTFSVFVMKALGRMPSHEGMAAMQSINVAILNPLFLAVFMGTALISLALAVSAVLRWSEPGSVYVLVGSVLYLVGCILITSVVNIPMNDALMAVAPNSARGASVWANYLTNWTAWNHVRTVATLAATAAFIVACNQHVAAKAGEGKSTPVVRMK